MNNNLRLLFVSTASASASASASVAVVRFSPFLGSLAELSFEYFTQA